MKSRLDSSSPFLIDDIYKLQEAKSAARTMIEKVPLIGGIFLPRAKRYWAEMNDAMSKRPPADIHDLSQAQRRALETFRTLSQQTIGWREPNFYLTDQVGALLWCPSDILAGTQVLMKLGSTYQLGRQSMAWGAWERRTLGELLEYLGSSTLEPITREFLESRIEVTLNRRSEVISCLEDIADAEKAQKALRSQEEEFAIFAAIEALELAVGWGEDIAHGIAVYFLTREEVVQLQWLDTQFDYLIKKHGNLDYLDKWLLDPRYVEVLRAAKCALDVFRATPGEPPFHDR